MDGGERRTSQHETPYEQSFPATGSREHHTGARRYQRYASDVQPATTSTEMDSYYNPRRLNSAYESYDYQQSQFPSTQLPGSSIQDVDMQYQQYSQGNSRHLSSQQPTYYQNVQSYRPGAMLPPMLQQQQSSYQPMSQYQQRVPSASETITGQFAPQTYIQSGESATRTNTSRYGGHETQDTQYSSIPMTVAQTPSSAYTDPSSVYNIFQRAQRTGQLPEDSEEHESQAQDPTILDTEKAQYELQVKAAFESVVSGRLTEAKDRILRATKWLLSSIVPLGLHHDDGQIYEDRLIMWRNLNHCWEAMGLKQHDLTEEAQRTAQPTSQGALTSDSIVDLINQLIRLCDQVEHHGLVDYEMGMWEEQIVAIFITCLDQLDTEPRSTNP